MSYEIGILHPGAMGISVAATLQNSGQAVAWAAAGRSSQTRQRAEGQTLIDAGTIANLAEHCHTLVSVCPPHAAETVADEIIALGFRGLYIEANAIAPQRTERIAQKMIQANVTFVDGGIIGGPAWEPQRTWLYLSGPQAAQAAALFGAGPLETAVISPHIGAASALKMCFAAYTKGTSALLSLILTAADTYGVREDLEQQWSRNGSDFAQQTQARVRRVTAKAWRFAGEMDEMVTTFESIGLPGGFHTAAADIYRRLAGFKDAPEPPSLTAVFQAVLPEAK